PPHCYALSLHAALPICYPRLFRPVAILATLAAAATLWVMIVAIPTGNRRYTEITFSLLTQRMESEIQPRVFFEDFPNRVLYIQDVAPGGGWGRVLIGDTSNPGRPSIQMAREGRLIIDRDKRLVDIVLVNGSRYIPGTPGTPDEGIYDISRFGELTTGLDPNSVFPSPATIAGGPNNMTIPELREEMVRKVERGESPHPQI